MATERSRSAGSHGHCGVRLRRGMIASAHARIDPGTSAEVPPSTREQKEARMTFRPNAWLRVLALAALATAFAGGTEVRAAYTDVLVTNITGGNVTQYNPITGANVGSGVFTAGPLQNP